MVIDRIRIRSSFLLGCAKGCQIACVTPRTRPHATSPKGSLRISQVSHRHGTPLGRFPVEPELLPVPSIRRLGSCKVPSTIRPRKESKGSGCNDLQQWHHLGLGGTSETLVNLFTRSAELPGPPPPSPLEGFPPVPRSRSPCPLGVLPPLGHREGATYPPSRGCGPLRAAKRLSDPQAPLRRREVDNQRQGSGKQLLLAPYETNSGQQKSRTPQSLKAIRLVMTFVFSATCAKNVAWDSGHARVTHAPWRGTDDFLGLL